MNLSFHTLWAVSRLFGQISDLIVVPQLPPFGTLNGRYGMRIQPAARN